MRWRTGWLAGLTLVVLAGCGPQPTLSEKPTTPEPPASMVDPAKVQLPESLEADQLVDLPTERLQDVQTFERELKQSVSLSSRYRWYRYGSYYYPYHVYGTRYYPIIIRRNGRLYIPHYVYARPYYYYRVSPYYSGYVSPDKTFAQVVISGYRYSPSRVTIKVGGTVRWINLDHAPHTSTHPLPGMGSIEQWDSGRLDYGESYSRTFDRGIIGTFAYYCRFHPFMRGYVTIVAD